MINRGVLRALHAHNNISVGGILMLVYKVNPRVISSRTRVRSLCGEGGRGVNREGEKNLRYPEGNFTNVIKRVHGKQRCIGIGLYWETYVLGIKRKMIKERNDEFVYL